MIPLRLVYILLIGLLTRNLRAEDTLTESNRSSESIEIKANENPDQHKVIPETLNDVALGNISTQKVISDNTTLTDTSNSHFDSPPPKYINCLKGYANQTIVQLANDTELIKLLVPDSKYASDRDAAAPCVAVLFYSKNCRFSSLAAPHYNALPRAFPDIKFVAINAMRYHLFNTQNGIVGVPTMLMFHNGKPVIRYNVSEYTLESFIKFISRHTGIEAIENSVVTSADFAGPVVSSPSKDSDMFLVLSWLFIVVCSCYYFTKSKWWTWIVETIQRNWRDSEVHAQHEHQE